MRRDLGLAAVLLLASACSAGSGSTPTGPPPPAAVAGSTVTWPDGVLLTGTVTVPAGSTVELAPGASVRAAAGARLVVAGTLRGSGGSLRGAAVTVARGGALSLTGVDLPGSSLETAAGAGSTRVVDATISGVASPFVVGKGSTLVLSDVRVRDTEGASLVDGTLVVDRLSYDKAGNPGMVVTGTLRMTRSELFGNGEFEGDMLTTSDADEVRVSDTEIRDVHCAFHLVGVRHLVLERLSVHDNAYGFMAYGSDPDQVHRITDSDVFGNRDFGLAETPGVTQGRIVVDGGYWADNGSTELASLTQVTGKVERTNPAAGPAER